MVADGEMEITVMGKDMEATSTVTDMDHAINGAEVIAHTEDSANQHTHTRLHTWETTICKGASDIHPNHPSHPFHPTPMPGPMATTTKNGAAPVILAMVTNGTMMGLLVAILANAAREIILLTIVSLTDKGPTTAVRWHPILGLAAGVNGWSHGWMYIRLMWMISRGTWRTLTTLDSTSDFILYIHYISLVCVSKFKSPRAGASNAITLQTQKRKFSFMVIMAL